ncbi:flavodoxin domain-containing protein [Microbacterium allomyrinae]|uniref:Flavodoxin domain-containing protein n=1 Tax=Microbacterium allomyrinae TaxID=2830666 RepID=A0A9X1S309_9MICO|nr:flavodoxin domain-containing protein [Microbacterium allomyrinae]MCC2033266.1 flavodoxin domain-containing protein [Microbacterium allomyrinae]
MRIVALFGTESGNAEEVAVGIAKAVPGVEVMNMADADPGVFEKGTLYLIACATHGGGELPGFAQFLHDDLAELRPDLDGVRYAMFGLGDTSYDERYLRGAKQFDELLRSLGAARIGPFGEHDVMTGSEPAEVGVAWVRDVLAGIGP